METAASNRPPQDGNLLDLLDREDPKTTNLDLIIEERLIEESEITTTRTTSTAQREDTKSPNDSTATETDLDREDVITVKYLPIRMASRAGGYSTSAEAETKKVS